MEINQLYVKILLVFFFVLFLVFLLFTEGAVLVIDNNIGPHSRVVKGIIRGAHTNGGNRLGIPSFSFSLKSRLDELDLRSVSKCKIYHIALLKKFLTEI